MNSRSDLEIQQNAYERCGTEHQRNGGDRIEPAAKINKQSRIIEPVEMSGLPKSSINQAHNQYYFLNNQKSSVDQNCRKQQNLTQFRPKYKSICSIQINAQPDQKQNICSIKEHTESQSLSSSSKLEQFECISQDEQNNIYKPIKHKNKEITNNFINSPPANQEVNWDLGGYDFEYVIDSQFGDEESEELISRSSETYLAKCGTPFKKELNPRQSLREFEGVCPILDEVREIERSNNLSQFVQNIQMHTPVQYKTAHKQGNSTQRITKSYFSAISKNKQINPMKKKQSSSKVAIILRKLPLQEIQSEGEAEEEAAVLSQLIEVTEQEMSNSKKEIDLPSFRAAQDGDLRFIQWPQIQKLLIQGENRLIQKRDMSRGLKSSQYEELKPNYLGFEQMLGQDEFSDCDDFQIPEEFSDSSGIQISHLDYDSSDGSISPIEHFCRGKCEFDNSIDLASSRQQVLELSQNWISNRKTRASGGYLANLTIGGKLGTDVNQRITRSPKKHQQECSPQSFSANQDKLKIQSQLIQKNPQSNKLISFELQEESRTNKHSGISNIDKKDRQLSLKIRKCGVRNLDFCQAKYINDKLQDSEGVILEQTGQQQFDINRCGQVYNRSHQLIAHNFEDDQKINEVQSEERLDHLSGSCEMNS
ncbi:hypothetical protein FGO68_gene13179 [Halteria grandinella]|uniref:Uncharacterized protein n=1 Tax=Halteria grandinella TaxID=5974 RepID=A0A8J8T549_HALGN|nr:hypothetical protein FGO68_gene13179 [Halteria grandinella]